MKNSTSSCLYTNLVFGVILCYLCIPLTITAQEKQPPLDSIFAVVNAEPDLAQKRKILHEFQRSLPVRDSLSRLKVTGFWFQLAEKHNVPVFKASGYASQGWVNIVNGKYDQARDAYVSALSEMDRIEKPTDSDRKLISVFNSNVGLSFQSIGKFVEAFRYYERTLKVVEELGDEVQLAKSYYSISGLFSDIGQYEEATKYGKRTIELYEKNDGIKNVYPYFLMARNYLNQGLLKEAKPYIDKAMIRAEKRDNLVDMSNAYSLLASYDIETNQYEKAIIHSKKGIEEAKSIGSYYNNLSVLYLFLALSYSEIADFQAFDRTLNKLDSLIPQSNMAKIDLSYYHNIKSIHYQNIGNYDIARKHIEKSIALAIELNQQNTILESYKYYAEIESLAGNHALSYNHLNTYIEIKDSLLNAQVLMGQKIQEIKYETAEKEDQIKELEILELENETQLAKQQGFLTSGLIGLISVGLLSFFLYLNNIKRKKTNKLLSEQNETIQQKSKQNETLLKEIHHRVKNNLETVSALLTLQGHKIDDANAKSAMQASQSRVEAMGLLHQKLYQGTNLGSIEMKDYFVNLSEGVLDSFEKNDQVNIELAMSQLELDIDTAVPIGLIVNELLTNALKYAFPPAYEAHIKIQLKEIDDDNLLLEVSDNGVGYDLEKSPTGTGFGTQLVELLTKQLRGKIDKKVDNGTVISLVLKKTKAA